MSEPKFNPEIIKSVIMIAVKANLTDDVKIDYDPATNNYRVSVWKKGITTGTLVRTKKEGIDKWNKLITYFENYCRDLKISVNTMDAEAHVTIMILNDLNLKQTLLTITDGITHYDFMLEDKGQ